MVCTELCGFGHATMRALVRVVPPDQFASWLAKQPRVKPVAGHPDRVGHGVTAEFSNGSPTGGP